MLKRLGIAILTSLLAALPVNAGDVVGSGVTYPQGSSSSSISSSTGWVKSGTAVNLFTQTDKLGIGVANDGTYKVDILAVDSNAMKINNASGAANVTLQAQSSASFIIDAGHNGASSSVASVVFLTNGSQAGYISSDQADANKLKLDYGSNNQSNTGLVINSSHQVGIGTSAPGTNLKVEVNGQLGFQLQLSSAPRTSNTLAFSGQGTLAVNTQDGQLCISTSTNQNSFVQVNTTAPFSAAPPCAH